MNKIAFEDIKKSYNGKPGCMCGCNGNYAVASHFGIEAANKETGYEAYSNCADRAVKIAVNKINAAIEADDLPEGTTLNYVPGEYYELESNTRVTVVFLK